MLNAISTASVTAPPLKEAPQQAVSNVASQPTAAVKPMPDFTVSNIRVDNHLDLAILEFRSAKTGDVMRQYPTEKQIAGYQRAAQLENNQEQRQEIISGLSNNNGGNAGQNTAGQTQNPSESSAPAVTTNSQTPSSGTSGGDIADVTQGMAQLSDTSSAGSTQSYSA